MRNKIQNNTPKLCDNFLNKKELANILRVSLPTIDRWMAKEGLPYEKPVRCVRFEKSQVEVWLRKRRRP